MEWYVILGIIIAMIIVCSLIGNCYPFCCHLTSRHSTSRNGDIEKAETDVLSSCKEPKSSFEICHTQFTPTNDELKVANIMYNDHMAPVNKNQSLSTHTGDGKSYIKNNDPKTIAGDGIKGANEVIEGELLIEELKETIKARNNSITKPLTCPTTSAEVPRIEYENKNSSMIKYTKNSTCNTNKTNGTLESDKQDNYRISDEAPKDLQENKILSIDEDDTQKNEKIDQIDAFSMSNSANAQKLYQPCDKPDKTFTLAAANTAMDDNSVDHNQVCDQYESNDSHTHNVSAIVHTHSNEQHNSV